MTDKLYQINPYIREIKANIIEKKYINGKYFIVTDRTIFYPHMSGGQPKDKGTINGVEVIDVYEKGNKIIHVVKENITKEEVQLCIEWNIRFDHMQQHTGQHILSSSFFKLFNAQTVGFHLGSEYVTVDIDIRSLSQEDIEKIEEFANTITSSNFNIKTYTIENNEVSKIPLRKSPTVDSNIRIVEIENVDFSPCSGTHTRSTGEVGLIKIRKFEKYKGIYRIEFVCGGRSLKDYNWKNNIINKISSLLSTKDIDTLDRVSKLNDENNLLNKKINNLQSELLEYKTEKIINEAIEYNDIKIISKIFDDADFKDLRNMTMNLINNDNYIIILGLISDDKCQFIIGRSKDININLKNIFNNIINVIEGKGGGSPQVVQGGGPKSEDLHLLLDKGLNLIKDEIKALN